MSKEKTFKILNDFFDHIYVISLKRCTDRQKLAKNNLKGLDFDFFWGVDNIELEMDEIVKDGLYHPGMAKLIDRNRGNKGRGMSKKKIACALSHANVMQDMIKNKYHNALILEDDILVDDSVWPDLENGLTEMPTNWDMLYLGYHTNELPMSFIKKIKLKILHLISKRLKKYIPEDVQNRHPRHYSKHLDISGRHFGAHGYALSLKGAKIIISYKLPISIYNDNLLCELCNYRWINSYNLKRRVFYQNHFIESTIISNKNQNNPVPKNVIESNKIT